MIASTLSRLKLSQKVRLGFGLLMVFVILNALIAAAVVFSFTGRMKTLTALDRIMTSIQRTAAAQNRFSHTLAREDADAVYRLLDSLRVQLNESKKQPELKETLKRVEGLTGEFRTTFQKYAIEADQAEAFEARAEELGGRLFKTIELTRAARGDHDRNSPLVRLLDSLSEIRWQRFENALEQTTDPFIIIRKARSELSTFSRQNGSANGSPESRKKIFYLLRDADDYLDAAERSIRHHGASAQTDKFLAAIVDRIDSACRASELLVHERVRHEVILSISLLLLLLLAATVTAVISGLRLSREISAPVTALLDAIRRLSAGDLDASAAVMGQDEIGELASGFNDMSGRLRESRDQLAAYSRSLEQVVIQRTAELELSRSHLETILDNLPMMAWLKDPDGRYRMVNSTFAGIVGRPREEIVGCTDQDLFPRESAEEFLAVDRMVTEQKSALHREEAIVTATHTIWSDTYKSAVLDLEGNVVGITGCAWDISSLKKAYDALQQSEERFRHIMELCPDIISIVAADGSLIYNSPAARVIHGYSDEEMTGRDTFELFHPDDRPRVKAWLDEFIAGDMPAQSTQYRYRNKDGTYTWMEAMLSNQLDNTLVRGLVAISRDITERKQVEQSLRTVKDRLEATLNALPDLMFITDRDGRIHDCHYSDIDKLYTSPAEFMGRRFAEILPEEASRVITAALEEAARTGSHRGGTYPLAMARGELWFELSIAAMGDRNLPDTKFILLVRDITIRKRAEELNLALERQLLNTQRLESLGVMAGGVAHDYNNLLQAMMGNLEVALKLVPGDDEAHRFMVNALRSCRRAAHLTGLLLNYAGSGAVIRRPVNLNRLIRDNAELIKTAATRDIATELNLATDLPPVMADEAQLQQVVMNLITNAAEAIEQRPGLIRISTGVCRCSRDDLAGSLLEERPEPGEFVFIEVRDTGCGMESEVVARLFDPFFTTKFTGRGLGMSAVRGIVRSHHGAIFITSAPGAGTTFRILFPADTASAGETGEAAEQTAAALPAEVRNSLILIVDDEKAVLKVCAKMVELAGYRVLTAGSGTDALATFAAQGAEIDLVLLDLTMPDMDGMTVMAELLRLRPELKVVLASGYSEEELGRRMTDLTPAGFIQKPYTMSVLEAELAGVLSKEKPD